jgi:hypothetical protein
MSGPQRNPDSINTVGIVIIGICAAVLVYVTITALQAFYMNDTADVQTMADYGGNDTNVRRVKAEALGHISESGINRDKSSNITSYRIPIQAAMAKVVEQANAPGERKLDELIPGVKSNHSTVQPQFGRPLPIDGAAGSGSGSAAGPGSGSGSAAPAEATGSGSAAGTGAPATAPQTPTGGQAQGGGSPPAAGTNNAPASNGSNSPMQGSANGSGASKAP